MLITTGLAGAGVMVTMMRYEWLTLPAGVLGVATVIVVVARLLRVFPAWTASVLQHQRF